MTPSGWSIVKGGFIVFPVGKLSIWLDWVFKTCLFGVWVLLPEEFGVRLNRWGSFTGLAETLSSWTVDSFEVISATSSFFSCLQLKNCHFYRLMLMHSTVMNLVDIHGKSDKYYFNAEITKVLQKKIENVKMSYKWSPATLGLGRWGWSTTELIRWNRRNTVNFLCELWYWLLHSWNSFLELIDKSLHQENTN